MKKLSEKERKSTSFKAYIITNSIVYTADFLLVQFLGKYFLSTANPSDTYYYSTLLRLGCLFIFLLFYFFANIQILKKKYKSREDYNKTVARWMIAYTAVLLLINLFVW